VITAASLKTRTVKDLASLAKRKRIPGWHSMRKDELIKALLKAARSQAAKRTKKGNSRNGSSAKGNGSKRAAKTARAKSAARARQNKSGAKRSGKTLSARTRKRLLEVKAKLSRSMDLALDETKEGNGHTKDRLVAMVRDPYWLHAYWELTRRSVERARVAMGQHWHGARPVLRLLEVTRDGTTSTVRKVARDVEIHGGVNNWYVDVYDPPRSFQLDIGYLGPDGGFLCLARSNMVTTPQATSVGRVDGNWAGVAEDYDRIYALSGGYTDQGDNADLKELFEERLRRPMGSPMLTRFGRGAQTIGGGRPEMAFRVDADLSWPAAATEWSNAPSCWRWNGTPR
jgi:hypothetical protein